jgi:small subunit ribosomal protein S16
LRLWRGGKKKQPIYRIVVADSKTARNGKYIEAIGQYDPGMRPAVITVKDERLYFWLKRGAQPSDTVRSLLQRKGLWLRWGMMKKGADEAAIIAKLEVWAGMQEGKVQREADRKLRRKAARRKKATAEGAPAAAAPAPAAVVAEAAPVAVAAEAAPQAVVAEVAPATVAPEAAPPAAAPETPAA